MSTALIEKSVFVLPDLSLKAGVQLSRSVPSAFCFGLSPLFSDMDGIGREPLTSFGSLLVWHMLACGFSDRLFYFSPYVIWVLIIEAE